MGDLQTPEKRLMVACCGQQEYVTALRMQELLVERKLAGDADDWLLLLSHPPVVTVGRSATAADEVAVRALEHDGVSVVRASRGGRLTYHGPGQIIGYPIVDLSTHRRDLHAYMRDLETVIIRALADHGISAHTEPAKTGVWLDGKKIAAIGIAVRSWITYHGFALNLAPDLRHFRTFSPCGLDSGQVSSVTELGFELDEDSLRRSLAQKLGEILQRQICWTRLPESLTTDDI